MKSDRELFVLESLEVREDFSNFIRSMPVWDNQLRTKSESLLIMFDQALEIVKNGEILNNGNHDNNQSQV